MPTLLAEGWFHRIDPVLIYLGPLPLRWYGLAYIAGAVVGYLLICQLSRRGLAKVSPDQVYDAVFAMLAGALVGGRLGFCFFYQPSLLWDFSSSFPFWGVLALHKGGMASHGGMIGMLIATYWFASRQKLSTMHLIDLGAWFGCLGVIFGRLANFINGELYGRVCTDPRVWSVKFPQEMQTWTTYHPEQVHTILPALQAAGLAPADGGMPPLLQAWEAAEAIGDQVAQYSLAGKIQAQYIEPLISMTRWGQPDQPAVREALAAILPDRYPSQLYQAGLEGLAVFLILAILWYRPRKVGVVSSCFVIAYAIARIIGEQYRMPDPHLNFNQFGLTRGQELSAVMLLIGVACLVWFARRPGEKLGGWGQLLRRPGPKPASEPGPLSAAAMPLKPLPLGRKAKADAAVPLADKVTPALDKDAPQKLAAEPSTRATSTKPSAPPADPAEDAERADAAPKE